MDPIKAPRPPICPNCKTKSSATPGAICAVFPAPRSLSKPPFVVSCCEESRLVPGPPGWLVTVSPRCGVRSAGCLHFPSPHIEALGTPGWLCSPNSTSDICPQESQGCLTSPPHLRPNRRFKASPKASLRWGNPQPRGCPLTSGVPWGLPRTVGTGQSCLVWGPIRLLWTLPPGPCGFCLLGNLPLFPSLLWSCPYIQTGSSREAAMNPQGPIDSGTVYYIHNLSYIYVIRLT